MTHGDIVLLEEVANRETEARVGAPEPFLSWGGAPPVVPWTRNRWLLSGSHVLSVTMMKIILFCFFLFSLVALKG